MIQRLLVLFLVVLTPIMAQNTAKPGCETKCGNLTVPYPFGVGLDTNCSILPGQGLDINCDTSFSPPRAFIGSSNIKVFNISDSEIRVSTVVARNCYDQGGEIVSTYSVRYNLYESPYVFSQKNKFTVVGCDDLAIPTTRSGDYASGCISQCTRSENVRNGSCDGNGCCQISIPKGYNYVNVSMATLFNHARVLSFNPCSYAFLGDESTFNFRGMSDFSDPDFVDRTRASVHMVLDWAVGGNQTCSMARANNSLACLSNSVCVDSDSGFGGYRCRCNEGYDGNPYLDPGCKDINECEDPNKYPCYGVCTNTVGSYNCSCPPGYMGDARIINTCFVVKNNSKNLVTAFTLGTGIGIGLILLLVGGWFVYKKLQKRKRVMLKQKLFKRKVRLILQQQLSTGDDGNVEKTKLFTSKDLEKATDHYNENRILGQGGQGTVYKGMLTDGRIVAVKKSKIEDEGKKSKIEDEGMIEHFINEVVILSQINHRNIVKLHGCCLEKEVPLLVYEFIPNGTLYQYIHEQNEDFPLSWETRVRVATEIAGALSYLHSAAAMPIYHRDIKSTNILLDEKYRAKVADFGTSRSIAIEKTHLTTQVQGTFGYLDPEYFQSSQFTDKSDVYSFGVVLVELLTGQKPILSPKEDKALRSLATHFLMAMEEDHLFDMVDPRVMGEVRKEEIVRFANLAKRCLNLNGRRRPAMKEVAMELEQIRTSNGGISPASNEQKYDEIEYVINLAEQGSAGPWDTNSTAPEYYTNTGTSSLETRALLTD